MSKERAADIMRKVLHNGCSLTEDQIKHLLNHQLKPEDYEGQTEKQIEAIARNYLDYHHLISLVQEADNDPPLPIAAH